MKYVIPNDILYVTDEIGPTWLHCNLGVQSFKIDANVFIKTISIYVGINIAN